MRFAGIVVVFFYTVNEELYVQYLKSLLNAFTSAEALKDFINPGQEVLAGK